MGRYLTLLAVLACVSGCAGLADPYKREGTWVPTGVNADNLRAMVVNPIDLQEGRGASDTPGSEAATAVARLREDKVKQLPASAISEVGGSSGSGGQGSGGSGASQ